MTGRKAGRAVFYTRDSGGRHVTTPGEYVEWARKRCEDLNVVFNPSPTDIREMIDSGESVRGDLYLDFEVPGHELSRIGLDELISRVVDDENVSHILIPRRDRLARPNNPLDAITLENVLREAGLTVVFMDRVLQPRSHRERPDIAEMLTAMLDYESAGKFRRELSEKMIYCQIALAKAGYSTGGRAPFGFDRWLSQDSGTPVRKLEDGERVRMEGHHVIWLPGNDDRLQLALRIREMLLSCPASRVAAKLNEEGIPSPDSGRYRTDNGVRHRVSGVWHQTTVSNIGRNPLLAAVVQYGRRSMGDQTRFTPHGPRGLNDDDVRANGMPKVTANPPENVIKSPAHFDAVVSIDEHEKLQSVLNSRATTQRGKPRSRDPKRNPLGCRVYDMECSWPMYRVQQGDSYRYKCGLYQQSKGKRCSHNHVDGKTATAFVLSCIRQRVLAPKLMLKVEARIRQIAADDVKRRTGGSVPESRRIQTEITNLELDLKKVTRNLALADSDEKREAISKIFDEMCEQLKTLRVRFEAARASETQSVNLEAEVDSAIKTVHSLTELATSDDLSDVGELIRATDARLFLSFEKVKKGKRKLNQLKSGTVVLGNADDPIERYSGPTSPAKVRGKQTHSGDEVESLRNVSRDDRI